MQDQLHMAGELAAKAGAGSGAPGANKRGGDAARLGLLALLAAREDGCGCRACRALRKQSDLMFSDLLSEVAGDDPSENPATPPGS